MPLPLPGLSAGYEDPKEIRSSRSPVPAAVLTYSLPSGDSFRLYTSANFPVHPLGVLPGPSFLPPTLCMLPVHSAFSGLLRLRPLGPVRAPFPPFPRRLGRMKAAPQHSLFAGSVLRLVLVHSGYPWLSSGHGHAGVFLCQAVKAELGKWSQLGSRAFPRMLSVEGRRGENSQRLGPRDLILSNPLSPEKSQEVLGEKILQVWRVWEEVHWEVMTYC